MSELDPEAIRKVESAQLREAWRATFGRHSEHRRLLAERYEVGLAYVGHLFSGVKPISAAWKLKLAHYMNKRPEQIWPAFNPMDAVREILPPELAELVRVGANAKPDALAAAKILLEASARTDTPG